MRKQTKLVAVLSAAALLAIGASMTSFAATGWQEEDGTWVYYDKDEYKVSNSWKKSGNYWYYLDEDGFMSTGKLLTDTDENGNIYYVDDTGRMVTNKWVELENEDYYDDGSDEASATVWYYFQNTGKAYKTAADKTSFKTINDKKYAFDANGKMLYGWVNDTAGMETGDSAWSSALYYCGGAEDGAMTKGWAKIHVIDNGDDEDYWFYFNTNGKKQFKEKSINGKKYNFDSDTGRMISEWYEVASTATPPVTGYKYYNSSDAGNRQKGWFKVVPSGDVNPDAKDNEDYKWFYAESDGKVLASKLKSINGKKYAFNNLGEMVSGLQLITFKSGSTTEIATITGIDNADKIDETKNDTKGSVYYFGSGDDGAMKVGNQNVVVDGDSYAYSFEKTGTFKGQGIKTLKNGYIYIQGRKVKADTDMKYEAFTEDGVKSTDYSDPKNPIYLVNTSGAVMKNRTNVKDSDEHYWSTGSDGRVTHYGAEKDKK